MQRALAQAGVASRRKAEELIAAGRVEVNGQIVTELGTRVDPERDVIRVDRKVLETERKVYFVLFKPTGVVTTLSDPQGRPTIRDLLEGVRERVFAVGRLDFDAEGALIVTNDGELANRLMHPRYQVPRVYLAKVKGVPDDATLDKLRSGVTLEDGMARPDSVEVQSRAERNTWLKLVLTEGRPHLVKRMCAAIGHPVVRLYRPSYGGVSVEGLRPGQFRQLTPSEVGVLRRGGRGGAGAELKLPPRHHRALGAEQEAPSAQGATPSAGPPSQGAGPRRRGRAPAAGREERGSEQKPAPGRRPSNKRGGPERSAASARGRGSDKPGRARRGPSADSRRGREESG
ncbi:MAG: pseudouridine synthase, partial [Myxococcales bacterium]